MRLCLFQFSLRDQSSNWLECLTGGSITIWEDLTTRFLDQFFPLGRTAKLRNDIMMFQQHQGESFSESWTRFKDLLQKVPHHGIDLWLQVQIFYDHVNPATRRTIDQSVGGKLRDRNAEESWALLEDLALYDNENVPSTSNRHLIKLENQVQRLTKAHLTPMQPAQVNKITSSCEICSGPHDTQYSMEIPNKPLLNMHPRAPMKWEVRVLKAIKDRMAGALPRDTVNNSKLNINTTTSVLSARSYPTEDPQCSSHPSTLINAVKTCSKEASHSKISLLQTRMELRTGQNGSAFVQGEVSAKIKDPGLFTLPCRLGDSKPFDTLANLGSCVNIILLYLFKKLNLGLLEETDHIFGLADGTKSYPVGIVKDIEVRIGKLKLLNDFYIIDMKKDPKIPLLVGRGFLETANVVIDCRKAKIADFLDYHLPGEWKIARDAKINSFKDVLVFRRMVEFLGALPINLKRNMWESKDLIENPINWDKPPKDGDGAWHAKIRIIDPDGEEFTKTLQSIPTTRKLSERESPESES
ncbi:zinc finger, CCHC-type containing protein [Tanacetum coccineum]